MKKSKLFSTLACFIVSTVAFAAKIDTVKTCCPTAVSATGG